MSSASGYFWLRRLHSFSGVLLSFAYVICFLIPLSMAFKSPESFNFFAILTDKIPLIDALEVLLVLIPLLFHLGVGLSVIYGSQLNVIAYGTYGNWMYALQRITGIFLIPFLAYHIYATRLLFAFTMVHADYAYMHKLLGPTWVKALYGAGVVCAAFHIGNGISAALMKWGITVSRRAQDVASMVMWVVTLILALWGGRVIMAF